MAGKNDFAGYLIAVISVAAAFTGCVSDTVYSDFRTLRGDTWLRNDPVCFDADSVMMADHDIYDLYISIRFKDSFQYKSLWILFEKATLDAIAPADTICIPLTYDTGDWKGKVSHGIVEVDYPLSRDINISRGCSLELSHCMPQDTIPGIMDVGIKFLKKKSH